MEDKACILTIEKRKSLSIDLRRSNPYVLLPRIPFHSDSSRILYKNLKDKIFLGKNNWSFLLKEGSYRALPQNELKNHKGHMNIFEKVQITLDRSFQ